MQFSQNINAFNHFFNLWEKCQSNIFLWNWKGKLVKLMKLTSHSSKKKKNLKNSRTQFRRSHECKSQILLICSSSFLIRKIKKETSSILLNIHLVLFLSHNVFSLNLCCLYVSLELTCCLNRRAQSWNLITRLLHFKGLSTFSS